MKKPRLTKAESGPEYERLIFPASRPWLSILWWGIAFAFILATTLEEPAGWIVSGLLFAFLLVFGFYLMWGPPTLWVMASGPEVRSVFERRRWRWSEVEKLQLMESRWLHRPVLTFKPPGQQEVLIRGPWGVDGLSVVTAMQLGKARWNASGGQ